MNLAKDYNITTEKEIIKKTFTIKGTNKTYTFEFYDFLENWQIRNC